MATGPRVGSGQFSLKGSYCIRPADPVKVGPQHQLLMDGYVVDDWWDCWRTVHQPDKYPENPLLTGQMPWEGDGFVNGTVFYDEDWGKYRLWASSYHPGLYPEKAPFSRAGVYYESDDGIHWARPSLNLIEWEGNLENNLFMGGEYLPNAFSVQPTPEHLASRGQYVMLYGRARAGGWSPGEKHTMQQRIAFSEDGIRWQDQAENPAFYGRSDCHNNFIYNPQREVFMQYRRATVHGNEIRRIAYSESSDLISWTQPTVILKPDELDPPMLYGMPVCLYRGVYWGFLQMLHCHPEIKLPKSHQMEVQLAWSRDGVHWERHPQRPLFLEPGMPGSYDWGMVTIAQGLMEREGQIRLYYHGAERLHFRMPGKSGRFCLATLRPDGFVSVDAGCRDGYLLTKPLECPGGHLHLNLRTGPEGFVKVALRRGDGEFDGDWMPEWNYDANVPACGDSLDQVIHWQGQENLDALQGKAIRIHFWLRDVELFSFWFE